MTDKSAPAKDDSPKSVKEKAERDRANARWAAGAAAAAMGIGSAALVATLMYTTRDKKDAPKPKMPKHAPESD